MIFSALVRSFARCAHAVRRVVRLLASKDGALLKPRKYTRVPPVSNSYIDKVIRGV